MRSLFFVIFQFLFNLILGFSTDEIKYHHWYKFLLLKFEHLFRLVLFIWWPPKVDIHLPPNIFTENLCNMYTIATWRYRVVPLTSSHIPSLLWIFQLSYFAFENISLNSLSQQWSVAPVVTTTFTTNIVTREFYSHNQLRFFFVGTIMQICNFHRSYRGTSFLKRRVRALQDTINFRILFS